jgi:hypothetical protein
LELTRTSSLLLIFADYCRSAKPSKRALITHRHTRYPPIHAARDEEWHDHAAASLGAWPKERTTSATPRRGRRHGRGLGVETPLTGGCKASKETCVIRSKATAPECSQRGLQVPLRGDSKTPSWTRVDSPRRVVPRRSVPTLTRTAAHHPSGCRPVSLGPSAF